MQHKGLLILLLPLFLFFGSPVNADIGEWQLEKQKVEAQRAEIRAKMLTAEGNEKIKLGMEDNKLAAYQKAYEQAISYVQPDQMDSAAFYDLSIPAAILPGQVVPEEYKSIYKTAGERFGVDWYVLAAIHDIETDFSRIKLMVSSAGAIGHMQFMPSTFSAYGVDGNGDGRKDPWNLEDAIHSAANYLAASGYKKDIRKSIWHYNHADWYVNDVIETAARIRLSL
ncbi:lytic transglycosylase domain-containing protein [Cytobacillus sp. Bac17]|uniref:lytic transglycosylase domain-containing protein n=1 Tax=Cytobacillus sp. Bac17 TaxID=2926008 RepID=UPI0021185F6C|nr:lytic transglycosylase domain-containing protein [Cytobacillus sp. Bac17]